MKRNALIVAALCALLPAGRNVLAQSGETPRLEIGVQFTALGLVRGSETYAEPGFGGRLTYNLTDSVAVEAEGNFFPRHRFRGTRAGGRAVQGLFGVKVGRRFKRFGFFAKARPGFVSFGEGVFELLPGGPVFDPAVPFNTRARRLTHFAADLGGVIEFYASRRILLRLDAGDTIIRYGRTTVNTFLLIPGDPFVPVPLTFQGSIRHNPQLSVGVGFRF